MMRLFKGLTDLMSAGVPKTPEEVAATAVKLSSLPLEAMQDGADIARRNMDAWVKASGRLGDSFDMSMDEESGTIEFKFENPLSLADINTKIGIPFANAVKHLHDPNTSDVSSDGDPDMVLGFYGVHTEITFK